MELELSDDYGKLTKSIEEYILLIEEIRDQFMIIEKETSKRKNYDLHESKEISDLYDFSIYCGNKKFAGTLNLEETIQYIEDNNYDSELIRQAIFELMEKKIKENYKNGSYEEK